MSPRSLWGHADFRRLWAAQAVSAVGSRITRTALPIIAINSLGASATAVSILSAMALAPGVIVALFAAGRIDRSRKRPLLIAMDLARAGFLLSLPVAAWFGMLTIVQLVAVAALTGAATAIFRVADSAYLPRLVDNSQLVEGNTKLQTTEAIAEVAGPSIAGILIQAVTAPVAIVVDALSFLWSALWLRQIRAAEAFAAPSVVAHPLDDIREGWHACRAHPIVFPLLMAEGTFGFFAGFFASIYMLFALRTLALDEATVGLIIGVGGLGALWGAAAAAPMARTLGYGRAVVLSLALWVLASVFIPAAEGQDTLKIPFLIGQQIVGDGFLAAFFILGVSIRQRALDPDVQSRAGATFQAVGGLSLPLGALIAGPLAEIVGPGATLWIAIAGALVPLLILSLSRLWQPQTLDDSRLSHVTGGT
ncbi:MAG: MFS transporter [Alphaproteobacteria bacterium]|nr:MFS transporter [Alphaproteobacteria bacterium]